MQPRRRNEKKLSCLQNSSFLWVSSPATSLSRYFTAVKPKISGAFTCSQTMLRVHQENQPLVGVPTKHWLYQLFPLRCTLQSLSLNHTKVKPLEHYGQRQQHWAFNPSSHSISLTVLSPPGPDSNLCSRYITATYLRKKSLLCFFQALMQIWPQEYVRHL